MLKRVITIIALVMGITLIVIQFFAIDRTNPPINDAETLEALVNVPADVSQILSTSCNDCHSHKTVFPWYSRVQPFGWFLRDHIDHGKSHLNFSVFATYDDKKKGKLLEEVCDEITGDKMPLPSYLWIHHDAKLTDSQKKVLCDWSTEESRKFGR